MRKVFVFIFLAAAAVNVSAQQQNSNAGTSTVRASQARPTPTPAIEGAGAATTPARTRRRTTASGGDSATTARPTGSPAERAVRGVFDTLVEGIRQADVETVMGVYWNSPQLVIFNNNGTVTRGWDQVKANRESSYPNLKNVELEVRDVRVQTLGRDAALVTCLWRQSQEYRDTPETATGRLTLSFRLINNGWKVVHTHTSPEAPDPSRLLPSETNAEPRPTPRP
ncbi:MAG: YybH family protein [Pyrinomonadaceae bacterium]